MRAVKRLFRDESGQGTMEYILIIGLVVVFLVAALVLFKEQLKRIMGQIMSWISGQNVDTGGS